MVLYISNIAFFQTALVLLSCLLGLTAYILQDESLDFRNININLNCTGGNLTQTKNM